MTGSSGLTRPSAGCSGVSRPDDVAVCGFGDVDAVSKRGQTRRLAACEAALMA